MINTSYKEKSYFKTRHINVIHVGHKEYITYISKTFHAIWTAYMALHKSKNEKTRITLWELHTIIRIFH
jgi:hypothetical protein